MSRYRLGIPVKVVAAPLRSHDSRRWQHEPHLSVSLAYLRDVLGYLHGHDIHFYRLAGQLAPYLTHPALPQFHRQLEECATELAEVGDFARQLQMRLTLHPAHYVRLNSPDAEQVARAVEELCMAARLLDALGLGREAVIVIHVGSALGDAAAGRDRFVAALDRLPAFVRSRVAVENDDRAYSLVDLLWIHKRTGVRLAFDVLHHRCLDPAHMPTVEALAAALATWPADEQPKIHFSSPRTELRRDPASGALRVPQPNQHSDFIHPWEFIDLVAAAVGRGLRPFDIMLEAKAKELAVIQLRRQVATYAPDIAAFVG